MPSNFSEIGKDLQTAIPVPEVPIASIRNRLRNANTRHRARVLMACALAAITVLGSGTVLAAMMFNGVRIWLSGDKAAFAMSSFTFIPNPDAGDLRRVVADSTFPVVLPVGVPKGMHMNELLFSPVDHPNFIEVSYRNAKTDARSGRILLFDSSTVNQGQVPLLPKGVGLESAHVTQWAVGKETVIVPSAGQQTEIKTAMSGITPAESLVQNVPMLYRITILADQDRLADFADAIAPAKGRSVLVDRRTLSQVAILAQAHKPLLRLRSVAIGSFPTVGGKPDWAHVQQHATKEVAVSADGVRALAAVLSSKVCGSSGKMGSGFTCEMLINERSDRAYWIWALALNSSTPPAKYIMNPTTFRVIHGI